MTNTTRAWKCRKEYRSLLGTPRVLDRLRALTRYWQIRFAMKAEKARRHGEVPQA